jgi:hypothetical protein
MPELTKLSGIDLESLPEKEINAFTLRASIERGVKNAIKPWQMDMPPETSETQLKGVYNVMVEEYTNKIFEIVLNELYLK